ISRRQRRRSLTQDAKRMILFQGRQIERQSGALFHGAPAILDHVDLLFDRRLAGGVGYRGFLGNNAVRVGPNHGEIKGQPTESLAVATDVVERGPTVLYTLELFTRPAA